MNKFEEELARGAHENEISAQEESIQALKKAENSSLMTMGLFEYATPESIFFAEELTRDIIARTNLSLETVSEIREHMEELECHSREIQGACAEIIWHIQDALRAADILIASVIRKS